jgi:DTW domain-containing protein YfiP
MTVDEYKARQAARRLSEWQPRAVCPRCEKAQTTCYCEKVRPFASRPEFVILIHPEEASRAIATGRMAHRCLSNSRLIEGIDFTNHSEVNRLIHDPEHHPMVLYPAPGAVDLSQTNTETVQKIFPPGKKVLVFVIDATWSKAKQMKRLSQNLSTLPAVCFTPDTPSTFRLRKQPHPHCYSVIEALHFVLEKLGTCANDEHDNLLEVFDFMVNQQIALQNFHGVTTHSPAVRGPRTKTAIPTL